MKQWSHVVAAAMLLCLSLSAQARYLQADSLDVLGRSNDPAKLVAFQNNLRPTPQNYVTRIPYRPTVMNPQPTMQLNHLYGYANQNPVMNIDPTGEFAILLNPWTVPAAAAGLGALYCLATNCTQNIDWPQSNSFPDEQSQKDKCIERCSNTNLPSGDNGFSFWNCVNKCMEEDCD